MVRARLAGIIAAAALLFTTSQAFADGPPGAAVATAHPLATDAAVEILDQGGNAFDAAVAATAALAVVEPYGSGIGGGGFWLLHREADDFQTMVDGRETAPGQATRDMYLDESGEVRGRDSLDGPLAAGIPGTPAALVHITDEYGELDLATNLEPAIRYARDGFEVGEHYRRMIRFRLDAVRDSPAAAAVLLDDGEVPEEGHTIVQTDLALTLERLARDGLDGFYRGDVAERLVRGTNEAGGIWSMDDLADYAVVEREPVQGTYQGLRITSAAPPSAGGISLMTMLNILSQHELRNKPEAERIHLKVEAMRRAYRDRQLFLGDPDFVDIPIERLTSMAHAEAIGADVELDRATPSEDLPEPEREGEDTTHFSIIDRDGNRVGATLSINYPFGSGFMPPGSGVLLNNEMDDFASQPGKPNAYGLVGGEANAIEPGKRPLSSMTPTFVESDDRVAVIGSPGGSRIITQVLLGVISFSDHLEPEQWVARPRFHHQYLPDKIEHEPGAISVQTRRALTAKGHTVRPMLRRYGDMQVAFWNRGDGVMDAVSDPRGGGEGRVTDE
ncbi:gamma-glutamyltransferase [Aquisalimonas asiatica]|uniref:Glutathione hydrolase proenzyme n=1 Tax=Aquisalimonas asiatica TaxID=406100 RepID=A0A1H8VGA4_9GAMM|nr:gamma-glutamyltransferase [Aquisalimonas asiatica]SEP14313.1 gamma-glutamyltranspeptidase / glutathione hydrolase [Aquisalimonas asiatica]